MELEVKLILYILLGAVAGMLYSLKRVLRLERMIITLDEKISKKLGINLKGPSTVKVVRKIVTKKKTVAKVVKAKPKKKAVKKKAKKGKRKKR
jgi:hypothetical protein